MAKTNATTAWNMAELLRGLYQPNQYGDVILPFTILRRLPIQVWVSTASDHRRPDYADTHLLPCSRDPGSATPRRNDDLREIGATGRGYLMRGRRLDDCLSNYFATWDRCNHRGPHCRKHQHFTGLVARRLLRVRFRRRLWHDQPIRGGRVCTASVRVSIVGDSLPSPGCRTTDQLHGSLPRQPTVPNRDGSRSTPTASRGSEARLVSRPRWHREGEVLERQGME